MEKIKLVYLWSIPISFIISILFLIIIRPSFIMKVCKYGKKQINTCSLLSYSSLFSISIFFIIFLCAPKRTSYSMKNLSYSPTKYQHSSQTNNDL